MNIIDLHCDTLMPCLLKENYRLRHNDGHISLEKLRAGGVMAQCFAIFIPTNDAAARGGVTMDPYTYYSAALKTYRKELAANTDLIAPALTAGDILKNRDAGKLSALLTVEDSVSLEGRLERVDEFFRDGVRMVALTWNYENSVGFPNSADPEKMALGLKPFGLECLARMNELGIVIDVSHLSEGGFWDVVEHSGKPFAASHSCARALCGHPRNLTDRQLRALADKGGVVGVNFYSAFLKEGGTYTSVEDIVRHAVYIANVAGVDALALGSDFDGIDCELEMGDSAGLGMLTDALGRRFTPSEMDKICGGNALRVLRDVIGA